MSRPVRLQSLVFEATQLCNHACLHCYNVWQGQPPAGREPYPRGELDTARTVELLGRVLDQVECRHVTLSGGEPLLRADLARLAAFLQERRVGTTLITNGRLLDRARIQEMLASGIALFELPLLSARREVHDQLSGAPGAWDAVLAAMAELRARQAAFVAVFVATRLNLGSLRETMRLAFAFGAKALMFNRFNPGGRGRAHLEALMPGLPELRQGLAVAEATASELGLPVACSIPIQPCLADLSSFPHLAGGFCSVGGEHAYPALDPLGNLRPCNHSDLILGNVFESPIAELLAPERLGEFQRALPAFCRTCRRRMECQGGCKASAQVCRGSLVEEEPFLDRNRAQAEVPL